MVFGTEIFGLWFATDGLYPDTEFPASWNSLLVIISWFFAFAASYCGLIISSLVSAEKNPPSQRLWTISGGIAMGGGIWAMHFVGMLAYDLPFAVSYDIGLTWFSWCIAVISMVVVVRVFALSQPGPYVIVLASLALASGIGGMHYVGMAGIAGEFSMLHDPGLFWLSLAVAFVLALIAYNTKFILTKYRQQHNNPVWRPVTGAVIATTITAMHYVAMSAVIFYPGNLCVTTGPVIEADTLVVLLMVFITMLIGLTAIAAIARNAMIQSDILRAVLDHSIDAFLVLDDRGLIRSANPAIESITGWKMSELVGFHMSVLLPPDVQDKHTDYIKEVNQGRRNDFMGRKRVIYLRNRKSERVPVNVGVTRLPSSGNRNLYAAQIHLLQNRPTLEQEDQATLSD